MGFFNVASRLALALLSFLDSETLSASMKGTSVISSCCAGSTWCYVLVKANHSKVWLQQNEKEPTQRKRDSVDTRQKRNTSNTGRDDVK